MERGGDGRFGAIAGVYRTHLALWSYDGRRLRRAAESRRRGALLLFNEHTTYWFGCFAGDTTAYWPVGCHVAVHSCRYDRGRHCLLSQCQIPYEVLLDRAARSLRLLLLGSGSDLALLAVVCVACQMVKLFIPKMAI